MNDDEIVFDPWVEPGFWTCAKGAPMAGLMKAFAMAPEDCVELSARGWIDEASAWKDLEAAFSFEQPWGRNWHAAGDRFSAFTEDHPRYLVVLRDIPDDAGSRAVVLEAAMMIGCEYPSVRDRCVVLEGWPAGVIEADWKRSLPRIPVRGL